MKTYLQLFILILVAVLLIGTTALAQTTGDWRSLVTPGSWIVANNWEQFDGTNWVTSTTIPGATALTDSTRSVTIRSGHTMTMTSATKHMKNLTVESGAILNSNVLLPASTAYPRYYGNVTIDGTYGSPTDGMGAAFYGYVLGTSTPSIHTISGGGTIYMSRIQPNIAGQTIIFDANVTATYAGSSGTGSTSIYNNAKDNITFTINAGKTVTLFNNSYIGAGSSGSTATALSLTLNVYGTLTSGTTNATINLGALTGKTQSLYVFNGGVVNVGSNLRCDATTGATTIINVAQGGTINSPGTGSFICGPATTTVNGTIDFGTSSTGTRSIGTATVGSTGKLRIMDTKYPDGAITLSSGATVELYGASSLSYTTLPATIPNLIVSNTAGAGLSTAVTVGTATVNPSGIFNIWSSGTLATGGLFTNSGATNVNGKFQINEGGSVAGNDLVYISSAELVFNNSSTSYAFNGTDPYWPAASGPQNVTVQNTGGLTINAPRTLSGLFQTAAVVNNSASNDLTVSGTVKLNSGGSFGNFSPIYSGSGSLVYNTAASTGVSNEWGSGSSVGAGVPMNVTIQGGSTVNMPASDRYVIGNLIITGAGDVLALNSGNDLYVAGNWTRNSGGTFTPNGRAVHFNGSANQTLTAFGGEIFDGLTLDNSGGNLLLANDATVNGTATLTNGKIETSTNKVVLGSAGTVSRTNGYIVGNEQIAIPTGAPTKTFDIGDANYYTPASVAFASVTTGGDLIATTTGSDHPLISGSGIDNTKDVNRYWSFTNNGVVFTTYDGTFNFNAADIDLGANTSSFIGKRHDGVAWNATTPGTRTGTYTQLTGLDAFSDFAVGEAQAAPVYTITASAVNGTIDPSGSVGVTQGNDQQFTYLFTTGNHFDSLIVDGAPVNDSTSSYTFYNVQGPHSITAYYSINKYQLTVNAGTGGTITAPASSPVTVDYGVAETITASANSGYNFVNWTNPVGTAAIADPNAISTTATLTTGNATVQANFALITYTLGVTSANGTVDLNPPGGTYNPSTVVTMTATAAVGYTFSGWTGDLVSSNNPDNITMDGNKSVTANYTLNTYTLGVQAGTGGTITVPATPPVIVNHGAATTITASANLGYNFVNWTVVSGTASIAAPTSLSTTVTLTSGNATVQANFALAPTGPTPLAGDYGTTVSGNWGVAGTWVICATNGTWVGATPAGAGPTSAVNAWVRSGHKLNVESSGKTIKNLFVENGGIIVCGSVNPTSSQVYVRIYGDSLWNGGSVGFDPAAPTVYTGLGFENYTTGKTVKFTGPGTYKVSRIRQGSTALNTVAMIDQNMLLTYAGSGGTGGMAWYSQGDNAGLTVNAGKTLSVVDYGNIGAASSSTSDGNSITITVNGTISMPGPNSQMNLLAATGKTITLTVNGLVDIGRTLTVTGTSGVTSILTVNSGGELRAGTAGTGGLIDFTNASQTINGAGTFTLGAGSNLLIGAAAGLDPVNGPIRTAIRNFPIGAGYRFVGTSAQVTGPELPTSVRRLTIGNAAGVTLNNNVSIDTSITFTTGTLTTGANMVTLAPWATISRTSGHIVGTLKEGVATGTLVAKSFPIGEATKYTPIDLTFATVTTGGDLTATTTSLEHPQIATSGIDGEKSLNRYYTLTNNGVGFDTYDANFTYDATDYDVSSNPLAFVAQKYDGGTWSDLTEGTKTTTSTQITGANSFSDFAFGERVSKIITATAYGTGTISPSGAVSVTEGTDQQFIMTAGSGSSLDSLLVDDVHSDSTTSYTFYNVLAPHTIKAYFKTVTKTITATAHGSGTISPSGAVEVNYGDDKTFTMTPYPGGAVDSLVIDGVVSGPAPTYTFTNVTIPHTIDAYFAEVQYTLGTAIVGSGSIGKVPDQPTYSYGTSVQLTATADPGYHFVEWSGDAAGSVSPVNVTMDGNKNVTATFASNGHLARTHGIDGLWSNPSVWEYGVVPALGDSILILAGDSVTYDQASGTIANLEVSGGFQSSKTMTTTLTITGDILLNAGGVFKAQTTTTGGDLAHVITLYGNITNNGLFFDCRTGTSGSSLGVFNFIFTGSGNTTITTSTPQVYSANGDFNAVTVNKQGIGRVILGSDMFISGGSSSSIPAAQSNLVFIRGKIETGSYRFVHMSTTNTTVSGASDSGYVVGIMGRGMSSSAGASKDFPVGDENNYRPVQVRSTTTGGGTGHFVTVQPIVGDANTGSSTLAGGIDKVSGVRYYKVKYFKNNTTTNTMSLDRFRTSYGLDDGVRAGNTGLRVAYSTDARATWNGLTQLRYPHTTSLNTLPRQITPDSVYPAYTMTTDVSDLFFALADSTGGLNPLDGSTVNFAAVPTSLSFGDVALTYSKVDSFVVNNAGTGTLNISSAVADSIAEFGVTPAGPVSIPASGSAKFYVTFHPTSTGVKTGNILLTHDGPGSPASVPLTGTGSDQFTITATAGPNGSISPSGAVTVTLHSDALFTIEPVVGYHVDDVLVDGSSIGAQTSYTFTDVSGNHTIHATFAQNPADQFNLFITAVNGTVTKNPDLATYTAGSSVILTAFPAAHYHFVNWSVDASGTDNPVTVLMDGNKNVTANFAIDTYTITASAGANGSISPSGAVTVNYGADQLFTISADAHYHVADVLVDGGSIGAVTSHTFTAVGANHTIAASFTIDTYTITATAGANGTITPSGAVSVNYGADQAFIIAADVNYRIGDVLVNGSSVGAVPSYTFTNVTADQTIAASFALNVYTLTVNVVGNGTVTKDPEQPSYNHGTHVELEAVPDHGWTFSEWSGDATGSVNPLDVTMDGIKNITATFILDPVYQAQYRSFDPDSIANSKDLKLKYKYLARKANANEFVFELTAPQSVTLLLKFSMASSGVVLNGVDTVGTWTNVKTVTTTAVDSGDVLTVIGWGYSGKAVKTGYDWATAPKHTKGTVGTYIMNQPRLPMPNRLNAVYDAFALTGFPTGLQVGMDKSIPDSTKLYGWLNSPKAGDVAKTLNYKGTHTMAAHSFDTWTASGKPFLKRQKSIASAKYNNILLAQMISLKLNIAASSMEMIPLGFGELIFDDASLVPPTGAPVLNGMMVKEVASLVDSMIMGWAHVDTVIKTKPVYSRHFHDPAIMAYLNTAVTKINNAFEGQLDTTSFSSSLVFTGVKKLIDVAYLKGNSSVVPAKIIPDYTKLEQIPESYKLHQNYPNPFNPTTMIQFDLPEEAFVTLKVYNLLGQEVATLINNELLTEGTQEIEFSASSFASGVYFYRLSAEGIGEEGTTSNTFNSVHKMILMK